MSTLVIVESPTKAKTIAKYLGKDFRVTSSMGHVRDLPKSDMGVDIEGDTFLPAYEVPATKKKTVTELKKLAKDADSILFATDEDREGEAISWHLAELLNVKPEQVKRLVFHEITKDAITDALTHPRPLNINLVDAQQARRVLDRLVGYELSPLLWKKVRYGLSAGRVQSVALHLLCERERARAKFRSATYADLVATLQTTESSFEARLITLGEKHLPSGADFDENTGTLKKPNDIALLTEGDATTLAKTLAEKKPWTVTNITETPYQTHAYPPFVTSTLQQEGSRKLGLSAKQTMRTAQALYEQGYITYMRTDSVHLSEQAVKAAQKAAHEFGSEFVLEETKQFATKAKLAQEAHEAIRPAGATFRHPEEVAKEVGSDEAKLYDLIWKRTVATQMKSANLMRVNATIQVDHATFEAKGKRLLFAGYLRAYVEGADNPEEELEHTELHLPPLKKGEELSVKSVRPDTHTTMPPSRYSEASLIKALEANGVGRPSTYATIMETILNREYAIKQGSALAPTYTGMIVDEYLSAHFSSLVDVNFTATMEEDLDRIAGGVEEWQPYIRTFYHGGRHQFAFHPEVLKATESPSYPTIPLGNDPTTNEPVIVKSGKFGPYLQRGEGGQGHTASIPDHIAPGDLTLTKAIEILATPQGPQELGKDETTGLPITLRNGRFGPYLQLGEDNEETKKKAKKVALTYGPKRIPIMPKLDPSAVTLAQAKIIIALPRTVGDMDDEPITASLGRFGPYLKKGSDFRSIPKDKNLFTITLDEAIAIFKEEKKGRGRKATVLKDLGVDPATEKPVQVLDGKYGPYISNGTRTFVSLPKDTLPESMTLELALTLLAEKKPTKGKRKAGTRTKKKKE